MSDSKPSMIGMSDGPHRTLNMRRPWKVLAERADSTAYSHADVVACLAPAVLSDWMGEVRPMAITTLVELVSGAMTGATPAGSVPVSVERRSATIWRSR